MNTSMIARCLLLNLLLLVTQAATAADLAVRGDTVHTMAGEPIRDGVVLIRDGKIAAVGPADEIEVPEGMRVLEAAVVTPGLIDAHSTVGFSGILNQPHDQDQFDRSAAIQPELRAIDAYNARDDLIAWVRAFGVTTVHTGHAPGELMSGQTLIVKTAGNTVDDNLLVAAKAVSATLSEAAQKSGGKSPGTRGKMMAMLRAELLKAQEYQAKLQRHAEEQAKAEEQDADEAKDESDDADESNPEKKESGTPPSRDLRMETLVQVLTGEMPLMVTVDRAQDIANALRLAEEFDIRVWLDSAAESYLLIDDIKRAEVPVLIHPTMARTFGDRENLSMETAAKLREAGIPVALQSGYEAYVPKTRVVLFEAGRAAANGLSPQEALAIITIDAARILGIDDRVGSIEAGKDADLALYDGDPLEYTTHCIGTVINGQLVSEGETTVYDAGK